VGVEGAPLLLVLAVVVVMLFAVAGVFYSFFVASVVVQRVWQKHYHVLAKRMLAKVRRDGFAAEPAAGACARPASKATRVLLEAALRLVEGCLRHLPGSLTSAVK
jgi:hypothetical protein